MCRESEQKLLGGGRSASGSDPDLPGQDTEEEVAGGETEIQQEEAVATDEVPSDVCVARQLEPTRSANNLDSPSLCAILVFQTLQVHGRRKIIRQTGCLTPIWTAMTGL